MSTDCRIPYHPTPIGIVYHGEPAWHIAAEYIEFDEVFYSPVRTVHVLNTKTGEEYAL